MFLPYEKVTIQFNSIPELETWDAVIRKFILKSIHLALLIVMVAATNKTTGQDFCHGSGGLNSIGSLPAAVNGNSGNFSGPYFIKVYIHVIRHMDGSGGQSDEAVGNAMNRLNADFNPHNIFFVRECDVIDVPVSEDDYLDFNIYCDLWQNPLYQHDDGIDLFFGAEEITNNAGGIAMDIPSKALWVGGTWSFGTGAPWNVIESAVMSHEMGHCLGLWHTHHGTIEEVGIDCNGVITEPEQCCELVNGSNSNSCGDYVQDTPADPRYWYHYQPQPCAGLVGWFSIGISECFTKDPITNARMDENSETYTPSVVNTMSYSQSLGCLTGFTPGQGERMRQMISFSPVLQACLVEPDYSVHTIPANTSVTWTTANTPNNGDFLIEDELVIEEGASLTIGAGVTVHFGEQGRVVIKPNARLYLEGTLTGMGCGITWKGVETWGNSGQSQYAVGGVRAQGWFIGRSGSVVENAETGVKLYGPSYTANAGGLITCSGTTFRNCTISVEIPPYENFWPYSFPAGQQGQPRNYSASLSRCTFVVNGDYPHGTPFHSFVHLTGVNGINLTGNSYTNAMGTEGAEIADWGYGIFANDAGFNVQAVANGITYPPSSYTNSEFNGLGYGIYTAMVVTNRPYQVRQSDFNNCFVGLRNRGGSGATILHNNFNLGEVPSEAVTTEQAGICFEIGISGFTCQENEFTNVTGTDALTTIGIFCDNTGDFSKEIRKNTFTGVTVGNLANGQNGANPNVTEEVRGLNYLCNRNFDIIADGAEFDVASGWVRGKQGKVNSNSTLGHDASGNEFSPTGTDFINSGAGDIEYFYDPLSTNQTPLTYSGNFMPTPAPENTCPTEYCEPPCKEQLEIDIIKTEYHDRKGDYLAAQESYTVNPTEGKLFEMATYRQAMDGAAYMVVIHQLYDTVAYHRDTLITWIGNMNSVPAELWLADLHLASGDAEKALQLLDNIPESYTLSSEEQMDVQSYREIANILNGQPVYGLDEAALASVGSYDQSGGNAGGWAQVILTLHGAHYPPSYTLSSGIGERSAEGKAEEMEGTAGTGEHLTVSPNPASSHVEFRLRRPSGGGGTRLIIMDMAGRSVQAFDVPEGVSSMRWDTGTSPSGIYFYQLVADGRLLQSGKIILDK